MSGENQAQLITHRTPSLPTMTGGGDSLMLWGCFTAAGTGRLVRIEGTMNGAKYRKILDENLLRSASDLRLRRRFTFQQDNDPKHTAKAMLEWLQNKNVKAFEWPSQNAGSNPIENCGNTCNRAWEHLQGRMGENPQIQMCKADTGIPKTTHRCFYKVFTQSKEV
jgi:hypothetical protein